MIIPQLEYSWLNAKEFSSLALDSEQFEFNPPKASLTDDHCFLCAADNDKVVGIVRMYSAPHASNMHIEFFEIAKDYRGNGISGSLYDKLFERAHAEGKTITSDGRTEPGRKFLERIIDDNIKKYGKYSYAIIGRV